MRLFKKIGLDAISKQIGVNALKNNGTMVAVGYFFSAVKMSSALRFYMYINIYESRLHNKQRVQDCHKWEQVPCLS